MLGTLLLIAALLLSSCTVVLPVAEELIAPTEGQAEAEEAVLPVAEAYPAPGLAAYPAPEAESDQAAMLAMSNEQLGALGTALLQGGLLDILLEGEPYTILAPTDAAFAALDDETVEALATNQDRLAAFLQFHVIKGAYTLADLQEQEALENLAGVSLEVLSDEQGLMLDQARIVAGDIFIPNAIVHVIDTILFPVEGEDIMDLAERDANLGALAALLERTDLDLLLHAAGPYTLLAPTDAALAAFFAEHPVALDDIEALAAMLQYHIIPASINLTDTLESASYETWLGPTVTFTAEDGAIMVDGATVVLANIEVVNGLIHLIDRVLMPPEGATPVGMPELLDLIEELGGLDTLAQVVGLETLQEQLAGLEQFTLFVPTDQAFNALPDDVIVELVSDRVALARLLQYHVAPERLLAADLAMITETMTLAGLPIQLQADPLAINGAAFATTDILVKGGVIHLIEAVLLPPEGAALAQAEAEAEAVLAAEAEEAIEQAAEPEEAEEAAAEAEVAEAERAAEEETAEAAEEAPVVEAVEQEPVAEAEEVQEPAFLPSRQLSLIAMLRALVTSGLLDDLEQVGAFTIFGPSDAALNRLASERLLELALDPQALRAMLEMHVVPGTITSRELAPGTLVTLAGSELTMATDPRTGALTVNGARILWVDMRIGDAVIHIIDQVLLPATAEEAVAEETQAAPEAEEEAVAEAAPEVIVSQAVAAPQGTLARALQRERRTGLLASLAELAELADLLAGEEPLTLLAPVDSALNLVPNAVMLSIIRQKDALDELLRHHIIEGSLSADDLAEAASVKTLAGYTLPVSVEEGVLHVGDAQVVDVIETGNGTLYLIDELLIYPGIPLDVVGQLYIADGFTHLTRLLELSGLADTLSRERNVTVLAPTDEAFEELTEAQMQALTADREALTAWLGRYIIPRRITTEELTKLRSIETLSGDRLLVRARRGNLFIGGTRVIERDLRATNGLIHAVDTVVLPRP
jgi:uncharacterized surface protein with fasciclin (FAS1) repeats